MFYRLLYQPLFNLLLWLYDVIPGADLGFAIIAISVLIKLVLWPLTRSTFTSQKALQQLQPKIEELKEKYKDDKEGLTKAMMQLYKQEKVNPLSSCLPLVIQMPILFALYAVLQDGLKPESLSHLYTFVSNPGTVNALFLGTVNLADPNIVMAVIAGALQFLQTKMLMATRPPPALRKKEGAKDEDMLATMNKSMLYVMPLMTVFIGASLPGGLTLYWIVMNLFTVIQQAFVFRKKTSEKKETGTSDNGHAQK